MDHMRREPPLDLEMGWRPKSFDGEGGRLSSGGLPHEEGITRAGHRYASPAGVIRLLFERRLQGKSQIENDGVSEGMENCGGLGEESLTLVNGAQISHE